MFVRLWVPFCHLQDARQVNFAASGAPFSASRASSNACTFTPLLHVVIVIVCPLCAGEPLRGSHESYNVREQVGATDAMIARMASSAPKLAAGSAGTFE